MEHKPQNNKIRSFHDLNAWKESHALLLLVYSSTKDFPSDERFGLTNQLRRASVSVTSNIAEGFGRQSSKEKVLFYFHAKSSILEIKSQLFAARDLKYLNDKRFQELSDQADKAQSILQGLIRSVSSR